jgi:hypothetical protein
MEAVSPRQSNTELEQLLSLRHPTRPGRSKVPLPLRKLLPDPDHEDGWRMFIHDVAQLTPAQRRARAWRLRIAIALCEPDDVCDWALQHLAALEAA